MIDRERVCVRERERRPTIRRTIVVQGQLSFKARLFDVGSDYYHVVAVALLTKIRRIKFFSDKVSEFPNNDFFEIKID